LWVRCGGRRDRALRAVDLLVRCPGFAMIALDLGETSPPLPLTRGFRLKLAARRSGTALVIVSRQRIAGPSASVAVRTLRDEVAWTGAPPTRLRGVRSRVEILRDQGAAPTQHERLQWWNA
jgi:hypothetical protein